MTQYADFIKEQSHYNLRPIGLKPYIFKYYKKNKVYKKNPLTSPSSSSKFSFFSFFSLAVESVKYLIINILNIAYKTFMLIKLHITSSRI